MTVHLEGITKRFPAGGGVSGISLTASEGEILALLGPSGCGKTTLLRITAGLLAPDAGRVQIGGRDVTSLPPERRHVGLVFQSYALFPHLSVERNVAYGLRARGVARAEAARRVAEALALVGLGEARRRHPHELSGGEQQRVALARALVTRPAVLLLDEPLSNLDAALRRRMRQSLREIQRAAGIPAIHVTHDQEEALAIADRIAVMDRGRLAQMGPPEQIFHQPASPFVARFLGGANVAPAEVVESDPAGVSVRVFGKSRLRLASSHRLSAGTRVDLAIRPEAVQIAGESAVGEAFPAEVRATTYLGWDVEILLAVGEELLQARLRTSPEVRRLRAGDRVWLRVDPKHVHLMAGEEASP